MDGTVLSQDPRYPARLKQVPTAPQRLYYRGTWDDALFTDCLAVVGTRRMTSYGKHITEALVAPLAAAGVTIVSGFMYGVDATAHQAALDAGGRTIAVMPCGIGRVYPAHQRALHRQIVRQGLVLSQFPAEMSQALWTFPKRNEVVAGLSQATLVVEGAEDSGALLTANLARCYGRTVFAVPGPVTSPVSLGPIRLLREGARVAGRAEDLLECFGKSASRAMRQQVTSERAAPGSIECRILAHLEYTAAAADELARALRLSAADVGTALSLLQLQGQVVEEGGRYTRGLG